MAIVINDNFAVNVGKPVDSKYMNISAPWSSVVAANAGIPLTYRYRGLTVNVNGNEYWYQAGTADGNLVIKSLGGTVTGATNGLSVYGGGQKIGLGGTILSGTTITLGVGSTSLTIADGRTAKSGIAYGDDYSSGFTANSIVSALYVTGRSNQVSVYCQSVTGTYVATCSNDFIGAQSGSTICLPNPPKVCQRITITDVSGHALEHMIIVCGNGRCINGADCATVNTDYGSVTLVNNGSSWSATAFIN